MMQKIRNINTKKVLLILCAAAAVLAAAALWLGGAFLPSWVTWKATSVSADLNRDGQTEQLILKDRSLTVSGPDGLLFETPRQWKVSDLLTGDINHDGAEELLLLVWKRGSYGADRPFWVEQDEPGFSQHIFIFRQANSGKITSLWMSSRMGLSVTDWYLDTDGRIHLTALDGSETIWAWESWGLTLVQENVRPDVRRLTLFAAGDNLIHEAIYRKAYDRETETFDFDGLYTEIRDLVSGADLAIVNQETPLTDDPNLYGTYPSFGTPEEVGSALADAGFDVILQATNHINDRGPEIIRHTLSYWQESHPEITVLGIHRQPLSDDFCGTLLTRNGITLALFNYTYGLNGHDLPPEEDYLVDQLKNEEQLTSGLKRAEIAADLSVCFLHIGEEYSPGPEAEQEALCRRLIDAGADVIICAHSHVAGPYGQVQTEAGNTGIVYYGCGNLVSDTRRFEAILGGAACLTIEKTVSGSSASPNGKDAVLSETVVSEYSFLPLVTHISPEGFRVIPLEAYTDELAAAHSLSTAGEPFRTKDLQALWDAAAVPIPRADP